MAGLIQDDTDLEMTRYNEAAHIKQYSGLSANTMRGGTVRYDPIRKVDEVYVDLPSGGKLRVGDRPVQMAQADILTTQTDATAAAPAALVPTATPAPVSLRPTAAPVAARQPIAEYDAQLRASSDRAPTAADFEGNYTAEEFAQYQQSLQGPEMVPVKLTPAQVAEYAKQPGAETVAQRDAGLGENIQALIYNALDPKREATGGVADVVRSAFSKLPGTENLDPSDLRFFSNLFTDFIDIGVSPVGAAISMDEGTTMMKQGWTLLSSGDSEKMASGAVDMTIGAALTTLGVAEFVPYVKALSEPVRGTLRQMSQPAKNLLADTIGASRAITQGDKDMLMEIFQPAGTPRSLGAAAPDGTTETPSANSFLEMAQSGNLRQARTLEQDISDITAKEMPANIIDLNGADEKMQLSYETGALANKLRKAGLFIEDNMMGKIYVGTTPENLDLIKKAKTPLELGKAYGYSDADIAQFYLKRRGGDAKMAFEEYIADVGLATAEATPNVGKDVISMNLKAYPRLAEMFDAAGVTVDSPVEDIQAVLFRAAKSGKMDKRVVNTMLQNLKGQ